MRREKLGEPFFILSSLLLLFRTSARPPRPKCFIRIASQRPTDGARRDAGRASFSFGERFLLDRAAIWQRKRSPTGRETLGPGKRKRRHPLGAGITLSRTSVTFLRRFTRENYASPTENVNVSSFMIDANSASRDRCLSYSFVRRPPFYFDSSSPNQLDGIECESSA